MTDPAAPNRPSRSRDAARGVLRRRSDLPLWPATILPVAIMLVFVVSVVANLEAAQWWAAQESSFFEHGAVVILLPGIMAGFYSFAKGRFPGRGLRWWILGWALACTYFAGEEASWGQHYFGWRSPETFAELNKQEETNLHNISSWLNMKPRTVVELWILVGGILVPVVRCFGKGRSLWRPDPDRVSDWFWPTSVGIAAASMNYVGRAFDAAHGWFDEGSHARVLLSELGSSEGREFFIAFFLSIYLLSIAVRVRSTGQTKSNKV